MYVFLWQGDAYAPHAPCKSTPLAISRLSILPLCKEKQMVIMKLTIHVSIYNR